MQQVIWSNTKPKKSRTELNNYLSEVRYLVLEKGRIKR